ncbi:GNAT family N-acetyltransferase [Corynebacterium sp. TAE3-ERU12]|uniref:N-acetylglutamate synthase, CG3035 family n=1 Tax=Corynebacterium sp. TAE3-ERU12 TaxID=2849491 RepID=UPI001C473DBE|nr:GNAT family N-acetyltransferase [Corynebacterium sp. TAE3-ERU12]MBV7295966.1 GNAT family N-acetyltransferase [Corynebacterium sp. TAE3-ERU12]
MSHQPLPAESRFGSGPVAVGRRVIVRRALTDAERATSDAKVTDLIGHVESVDPLIVRPQLRGGARSDLDPVDFSEHDVLVVKTLPDTPVRNSDIRAVETATAKAFPGIEHTWSGGWLLRAGDGITERSNSALPIGSRAASAEVPMADIVEFYRRHNLPVRVAVPDRICRPAELLTQGPQWRRGPEIVVMTRSAEDLPTPQQLPGVHAEVLDRPDEEWLSLYHFRGQALPRRALQLLMDDIDGKMSFGRLLRDGETVAITRGTLTESEDGRRWLGFSAVEVNPRLRRQGLGTMLGLHMMHWGAEHGADAVYLQVVSTNEAGVALYRRLGFGEHHRHRYAELVG